MKVDTLLEVFQRHIPHKADDKFAKRVLAAIYGWLNKNDNHTEFFSNGLLGTPAIRYGNKQDGHRWLTEVLDIDDVNQYTIDLTNTKEINKDWKISSDPITLSYIYVFHLLMNSTMASKNVLEITAKYALVMMHARWMSGLMVTRFPNPASPDIALALFESLDGRTDIKVHGSWLALFESRATDIMSDKRNGYGTTFKELKDERRVVTAINDLDRSLVSTINELTEKFHILAKEKVKIITTTTIGSVDGEKVIKDYVNKVDQLQRDMKTIVMSPQSFIKDDLLEYCIDVVSTASKITLEDTLNYLSDNIRNDKDISILIDNSVTYIVNMARVEKVDMSDVSTIVYKLHRVFRSSGTKQELALKIKDLCGQMTEKALPRAKESVRVSTRLALFIYIALRMLSMGYYD